MEFEYVLKMENISKEYSSNKVLKDVSFMVKPGEIHALMGENGAGKSTLMNILFGMPVIHSTGGYDGNVEIAGEKCTITTPSMAMTVGIGMVHQEFMLIPGFSVTENIKVGREISTPNIVSKIFGEKFELLDTKKMAQDAKAALKRVGLTIEEYVKVAGMPVGYMQFVEIAREIDKAGIKLLVLDEPTAVLAESEAKQLLKTMRGIADLGIAIIFISHRLDEVMEICDAVTVLRDGEFVARKEIKDVSAAIIAELMIGRKVEKLLDDAEDKRNINPNDIAVSIKDLYVSMPGENVLGINLDVIKGEILGIGGLAGQGKLGIPNGIAGLHSAEGEVVVLGEKIDLDKLGDSLDKGVAFVSEDRRGVGLLLEESIEQNIVFTAMQVKNEYLMGFGPFKIADARKMGKVAADMIKEFDIRCTSAKQPVGRLSGGNQQKVCLARALTFKPKVLMVSEPTRGIDIGAKKLVIEMLAKLNREQGMTIIMVSSELVELRSICDRIAIVTGGKIATILSPDASDVEYGFAMSGVKGGK